MKNLILLMLLAVFFANTSVAQCDGCQKVYSVDFATGVDVNNNLLPYGSYDGIWQITNAPSSANLGALPVPPIAIREYTIGLSPVWGTGTPSLKTTLMGLANYISPFDTCKYGTNNPGDPFTFTYTFCVCYDDSFSIDVLLNADDWAQLKLDGSTVLLTANNYANVFSTTQTVYLTAGVHTLDIDLENLANVAMGVACAGTITSLNGGANISLASCCHPVGAVRGVKYHDVNGNNIIDAGDTVMANWNFNLNGPGGSFSATTGPNGTFNFLNIPAGTYTLSEVIPPGWGAVIPTGGSTSVNVNVGQVTSVDFLNKTVPLGSRGCCDSLTTANLLVNGSFESGNTGFSSSYLYQSNIGPGSVVEGNYSVVTGNEAGNISNCWNVSDHTTCTPGGHFMVLNGRTHGSMSTVVYQQANITVTPNQEYIFCMYYRHLPQCAFDIFTASSLAVNFQNATVLGNGCVDEQQDCGWTKITYSVVPTAPLITISVTLNETGTGDGNDVAFDDFSFREKSATPVSYCDFNIATSGSGPTKGITATAVNSVPSGFTVEWTVSEVDCSTWAPITGTIMSESSWGASVTDFPGYCCTPGSNTPGVFDVNKCYKITRKVTSCCYTPCQYDYYVSAQPQPLVMQNGGGQGQPDAETAFYMSTDRINWTKIEGGGVFVADDGISLYPNPGEGNVTIRSAHSLEHATIKVYTADSKLILEQNVSGTKGNVDIKAFPNGVYSFELIEADGTRTFKKYVKK